MVIYTNEGSQPALEGKYLCESPVTYTKKSHSLLGFNNVRNGCFHFHTTFDINH